MKRIVVLGAGESGAGAAVLAKVKGFDTFVSDMSAIKDKYKTLLDSHGIAWEEGRHTEERILNADEVVKSPGIPNDAPLILKLKEQGTPIISEIEFAGRYTDAKMICITGSNGKTTTTSLIYHIFKSAGLNVGLAGNIGKSLALQVAEEEHDYYVLGKEVVFYTGIPETDEEIVNRIGDADCVLVSYNTQIRRNVIEACPNIKYIGMCCTLYSESSANVDIAAARERGITVLGIRDYGDEGVVEYVISELVRLLHGFGGKQWRHKAYELGGQKVGIVGLGRTGRMIADALRFLGAEVYYFSRTRKPDAEAAGIAYLPLRELLPEVDILCTCLPRNTILLGADEFRLFGNLKILINTSVGPTFRVPDLQRWLSAHKRNFFLCDEVGIGNYADTLTQFDNVIYTPKVSGHSEQCMERLSQKVIANIESYLN